MAVNPGNVQTPPNLLSTGSPGNPTTPGVLQQTGALGGLPPATAGGLNISPLPTAGGPQAAQNQFLKAYQAMQRGYYGPLSQQPQMATPQYSDATLRAIQQHMAALRNSHSILNGQAPISSRSKLVAQVHQASPQEIVGNVLSGIAHQAVLDPIKQFTDTWATDPGAGLLELAGGLALGGAIVAGTILAPEIALPALFLVGGMMTLPGVIDSVGTEMANPSDANLTRALVSTGAGAISMGSPIKAFRSLGSARGLLSGALQAKQDVTTAQQAADLILVGGQAGRTELVQGAPVTRQLETLAMDPEQLLEQARARQIDPDLGAFGTLRQHTNTLTGLQKKLEQYQEAGEQGLAAATIREIKELANGPLKDARVQVAYAHNFLLDTPFSHVPLQPLEGLDPEMETGLLQARQGMTGILRGLNNYDGLGSELSVTSAVEAYAAERAADSGWTTAQRLTTFYESAKKAAKVSEERVEPILQALEESSLWDRLSPSEQAFGQWVRDLLDGMSINGYSRGLISHVLQGRVPRYYQALGEEEGGHVAELSAWQENPTRNPHRTWKAAVEADRSVRYRTATRSSEVERTGTDIQEFEAYQPHRQTYGQHRAEFDAARRSLGQIKDEARKAAKIEALVAQYGEHARELLTMKRRHLNRLMRPTLPTERLITGSDAIRKAVAAHVNGMQAARFYDMLQSHAHLGLDSLRGSLADMGLGEEQWGVAVEMPSFKSQALKPDILPESVFVGKDAVLSAERNADRLGYYKIHAGFGNHDDFNYRPALYARDKLAREILKAGESAKGYKDLEQGAMGALYKAVVTSKRWIMASPAWHALNVGGRTIGFVLADPSHNLVSLRLAFKTLRDPASFNEAMTEFAIAGGKHADSYNVSHHLGLLQKEEDGQHGWPGVVRGTRAYNTYQDTVEKGFWRMVDQVQLAGYLSAKHQFAQKLPNVPTLEIQRAAAQFANNLGGMVNPLYMNNVYRQIRNLVWFAPNYWGTFVRSLSSALPGATRLSRFLAERDGGKFVRYSAVTLKAIDNDLRKELVRMNRQWFYTYMATAFVSADLMNVMGSGRHLWENAEGRKNDIDVTNFGEAVKDVPLLGGMIGGGAQTTPTGTERRLYISGFPIFRQAADLANAIGLGHDWGFGHQFSDPAWQQADAGQKLQLMGGALLEGTKRQAASKTSAPVQAGYEALAGQTMTGQKVDRWEGLLNFIPAGYQVQSALGVQGGTIPERATGIVGGLLGQFTGIPSMYHMAPERAQIEPAKLETWRQQRDLIHQRLKANSDSVFQGQMTPQDYMRQRQTELTRLDQLNIDTFGSGTATATLAGKRKNLASQFGLDQMGISTNEWFARYDAYQSAWQQTLQQASPEARAAWWEADTAQWTDADYLYWEAKQLKDALASSIDGQGGNYIKAYQAQIEPLRSTMTAQQFVALENADPYYSSYRTLLKNMGQTSALGAFLSAFSSQFTQTDVLPPGMSPAEAQYLAQNTGRTEIRAETAQQLAAQAKAMAKNPAVGPAGGQALADPAFRQEVQQDIGAAKQV